MTANTIMARILRRGWNGMLISRATGLTPQSISNHITGYRRNTETQEKIAACIGMSVKGLFGKFYEPSKGKAQAA